MKIKDVTIWAWDSYLADPEVQEAVKAFGGVFVYGVNSRNLANQFDTKNNIYPYDDSDPTISIRYLGEFGTRRQDFPYLKFPLNTYYADESSPKRISYIPNTINNIGYSSYRTTLFTIVKKLSDINIRIPILSPIWTLKRLNNKYGSRHKFVWIDLKKSLHFCYPWKMYIGPDDKTKSLDFNPFMKIPFQWHVRRMIRFCDKYGKRLFIYAGDYDASKESVLEGISIIKKYLEA